MDTQVQNDAKPQMARKDVRPGQTPARPASRRRLLLALMWAALAAGCVFAGIAIGVRLAHRPDATPMMTINGVGITRREFLHRCELAAGVNVLRQMTNEELQLELAKELGALPSDAQVTQKLTELRQNPDWVKNHAAPSVTQEDVRRSVLLDLARDAIMTKGTTITDTDVKAYYQLNTDHRNPTARYYHPESVRIAVIITPNQQDVDAALRDLAAGKTFAETAARYSKDRSSSSGGLLPAVRRGQMDNRKYPGLEKTLFALQPGQQIDKLSVGKMWWIIRCIGRQAETTTPFDKVEEDCKFGALLLKGVKQNGQAVADDAKRFKQDAKINILDSKYSSEVVK